MNTMETQIVTSRYRVLIVWATILTAATLVMVPLPAAAVGSWTKVGNFPYSNPGHMLLLSDGTVMIQQDVTTNWYSLKPDNQGHYVKGNWSTLASMANTRQYYASQVLQNGKVLVAGGEYGSGGHRAERFDPQANGGVGSWTDVTPPASPPLLGAFSDASSIVLADGTVMIGPVAPYDFGGSNYYNTLIYHPADSSWTHAISGSIKYQDEATWVKLPDDSILSVDIYDGGTSSERYVSSLGVWIPDGNLLVSVAGGAGEVGGAFLMPDGRAFWLGGSGHTAFYTPTGNTNAGSWSQGPDMPYYNGPQVNSISNTFTVTSYTGLLTAQDAPAAMMNNGKILCNLGCNTCHTTTFFFEFDTATGVFTPTGCPTNATPGSLFVPSSTKSDATSMVDLPDGSVLYNDGGRLYIYQPDGSPLASGKPSIQTIAWNRDGSLHLTGTLFNGISQGASYGDDAQMDSNYPLVRFIDNSGNVTYGGAYNWSSTGVQTGGKVVTTECTVPANIMNGPGKYSLQVVANGIASASATFYDPVWVDFNYTVGAENGTYAQPYDTLAKGTNAVIAGGTIALKPGSSSETLTISKPMTIIAVGGPATIGR